VVAREQVGRPLEGFDGLIVAIAKSRGCPIATGNTGRFPGLWRCGRKPVECRTFAALNSLQSAGHARVGIGCHRMRQGARRSQKPPVLAPFVQRAVAACFSIVLDKRA
jgi:hypothetical protein